MHAGAAAARRGMAQVLEEPGVPLHLARDQRLPERVIHRDELEQRVVVHLADRGHAGKAAAQAGDELPRAFVHVGLRVVHPAADDVEEVRVHAVALDDVGDAAAEPRRATTRRRGSCTTASRPDDDRCPSPPS